MASLLHFPTKKSKKVIKYRSAWLPGVAVCLWAGLVTPAYAQDDSLPAPLPVSSSGNPLQSSNDSLLAGASSKSIQAAHVNNGGVVTPSGAFVYSIPIDLPPAVNKMAPSLALVFSSQNANGLVGVGTSLAGLSTIERINNGDGINYTGSHDTFAFNVNAWGFAPSPKTKLVQLPSTAPGVTANSYHTAQESWSNFVPQGTCGNGPCTWLRSDPNGTVYEYGGTGAVGANVVWESDRNAFTNTGLTFQPRGIDMWALTKVTDRYGNYYTVDYAHSNMRNYDGGRSAVLYPETIKYTMNANYSAPGTVVREVDFDYERRTDHTDGYGFDYRMSGIRVSVSGDLLRRYQITYMPDAAATDFYHHRSRIQTVQEFGQDNHTAFPPYKFTWLDGTQLGDNGSNDYETITQPYNSFTNYSPVITQNMDPLLADVDGDGRKDLILTYVDAYNIEIQFALGTSGGVGPTHVHTSLATNGPGGFRGGRQYAADVNNDGFADLVLFDFNDDAKKGVTIYVAYGSKAGLQPLTKVDSITDGVPGLAFGAHNCDGWATYPLDINGDVHSDFAIVCFTSMQNVASVWAMMSDDTGLQPAQLEYSLSGLPTNSYQSAVVGDFNGDQKGDLVISISDATSGNPQVIFIPGSPTGFGQYTEINFPDLSPAAPNSGQDIFPIAGDFNGDGLTDLIYPWSKRFAAGTRFSDEPLLASTQWRAFDCANQPGAKVTDIDGDGIDDIVNAVGNVCFGDPNSYLGYTDTYVGVSPPLYVFPINMYYYEYVVKNKIQTGDINGDGINDVVMLDGNSFSEQSGGSTGFEFDDKFPNGMQFSYYLGGWAAQTNSQGNTRPTQTLDPGYNDIKPNCLGADGDSPIQQRYPNSSCQYLWYGMGDVTGDGIADIVVVHATGGNTGEIRYANFAAPADELVTIQNGYGGTVSITYTPSPELASAIEVPNAAPTSTDPHANTLSRLLATQVVRDNGREPAKTETYNYLNGTYIPSSTFSDDDLGFSTVTVVDQEGTSTVTLYYTNTDARHQIPSMRYVVDKNGNNLQTEIWQYQDISANQYLSDTGSTEYYVLSQYQKSTISGVNHQENYTYDHFGNVVEVDACDGVSPKICYYNYITINNDVSAWHLGRVDWEESYGSPASQAAQITLSKKHLVYAADGLSLQEEDDLLCDDAQSCVCTSGPTTQCDSSANARWVPVRQLLSYDPVGRVASTTDALGYTTSFTYDAGSDQLASEKHVLRNGRLFYTVEQLWYYDEFGRLTQRVPFNQSTINFGYDRLSRLNRIDRPDGGSDTYLFPNWGTASGAVSSVQSVVRVTAPTASGYPTGNGRSFGGIWSAQYFDGFGGVFETLNKADNGDAIRTTRVESSNILAHTVTYSRPVFDSTPTDTDLIQVAYDSAGRPSTVTKLASNQVLRSYDYSTPLQTVATDSNGHSVTTTFDSLLNKAKRIDAAGTTQYRRDVSERVYRVDLPNNTSVLTSYDSWGRRRSLTDPDLGQMSYAWNDVGNIQSRTDMVRNLTTSFQYDAFSHVTMKTAPEGITYYDYNENLQQLSDVSDPAGTVYFGYDSSGRITSKSLFLNDYANELDVSYTFDIYGHESSKTYPDGTVVYYNPTDSGNLGSVYIGSNWLATYTDYDASRKPHTRTTGAATTAWSYNDLEMPTNITTTSQQGAIVQSLQLTPDLEGNVMYIQDLRSNTTVNGVDTSETQSFTYDPLNRLKTSSGIYGAATYNYDAVGNITQKGSLGLNYADNTLTGTRNGDMVFSGLYDGAGHMVGKTDQSGEWAYGYDSDGNLTNVSLGGSSVLDVEYDYSGARRVKNFHASDGETVSSYYLDGYELRVSSLTPVSSSATLDIDGLQNGLVAQITTGTLPGQPTASGVSSASESEYSGTTIHGLPDGTYYPVSNQVSTLSVVLDSGGNVVSRRVYEPFGELQKAHSVGYDAATYAYGGAIADDETGLSYFGARYYDPVQARFLSADDRLDGGGGSQGFARHAYVMNNPVAYRDPNGHFGIVGGIAGTIAGAILGGSIVAVQEVWSGGLDALNWDAIGAGAAGGAVTGAIAGATGGISLIGDIGFGGLAGMLGKDVTTLMNGGDLTWQGQVTGAVFGAVGGGALGGLSAALDGVFPAMASIEGAGTGGIIGNVGYALGDELTEAIADGRSGSTTFLHGTSWENAEAIVGEPGGPGNLAPTSVNTHTWPQGSFFTHDAADPNSMYAATQWAVVRGLSSNQVGVVQITVPNSVLDLLQQQGLMGSGFVPGMYGSFPQEYVFFPDALPILNDYATFQVVPGNLDE